MKISEFSPFKEEPTILRLNQYPCSMWVSWKSVIRRPCRNHPRNSKECVSRSASRRSLMADSSSRNERSRGLPEIHKQVRKRIPLSIERKTPSIARTANCLKITIARSRLTSFCSLRLSPMRRTRCWQRSNLRSPCWRFKWVPFNSRSINCFKKMNL